MLFSFPAGSHGQTARSSEPASTVELANLQSKFKEVADRVAPSVVAISVASNSIDTDEALRPDGINTEKLEHLLDKTTRTVGTGFVIDSDGYILTNEHVIGDAGQIWITTDDKKVYPAIVVGSDPRGDLAVLKVPAKKLPASRFATVDTVYRGMWSIALGNPYGMAGVGEMSMSVGIVSALDRSLPKLASQENRYYANLIQTTAEINPGNSGGPLFGIDGSVIGISTAVILPQKSTNGIGFAMPITAELLRHIEDLKQGREIVYAYLGATVSTPTTRQRRAASITDDTGVMVDSIQDDSPAAKILLPGDIITKLNEQSLIDSDNFVRSIGQASLAQPAKFIVRRDGKIMTLAIQLRKRDLPSVAINRENQRMRWRGMLLGPIPANWDFGQSKRPDGGLMVLGIDATSPLLKQGVRSGSVITSVAGTQIDAVTQLQEILSQTPEEQCRLEIYPSPREAVVSGE